MIDMGVDGLKNSKFAIISLTELEKRKSYIIKRLVKTQVDEKLRNSRVPAI